MSLGRQLIKAAIIAGSSGVLRDIRPEFLVEEEEPLFQYVKQHLNQHGVLPSEETLQAAGFTLMRVREPASYYVDEIRKRYAYNQINERFPKLTEAMRSRNMTTAEQLLREAVHAIGSSLRPHGCSSMAEAMDLVLDDFAYAKEHPGLRGVTFGWPTLDELTLGAMGGDLVVIAGRPSMAKSWMLGKASYSAQTMKHTGLFITMEMPVLQIARRHVAHDSGVNPHLIRKGQLSPWGEDHLRESISRLRESNVPFHFLAGDAAREVQGIADAVAEYSPDVIYVDAAYLLSPSTRRKGYAAKWEQLSDVIRELKALAISVNRPIIMTVQFNRNVRRDQKESKKLDLGDIGGTDAIPQDASIVLGIRQGYSPFERSKRHIEVLKNREGEVKDFVLNCSFYPVDFSESYYPIEGGNGTVNVEWMT